MKPITFIILLSLCADLALGAIWIKNRSRHASEVADPKKSATPETSTGNLIAQTLEVSAPPITKTFSWADLQTDDLKEFVQRLRSVHCPEATIQDLILAEVDKRYQSRSLEIWPNRGEGKFWETRGHDAAEVKKNRDRWRKGRALEKEKSALLIELLGVDPEKELRQAQGWEWNNDWETAQIAFLPESKRDAVQKYLDDMEDKMQEFYQNNQGIWDEQYRTEQKALEKEKIQGLTQLLTPTELREYQLRNSQMAEQLKNDLQYLTVDRAQYEKIFDIREKYGNAIYNWGDIESKAGRQQVEDNKTAMNAEIAAALGPDLSKTYVRAQDYNYQQLTILVKRDQLPPDTAGKVYDIKEIAESSVKELQKNSDLSPEQLQAALQRIRTETANAVKQSLGDKSYQAYLKNNGYWINDLGPKPAASKVPTNP